MKEPRHSVQVVADAVYSEPCDEVLLVAAVRATASMSRNLPTSATGFMTAHIPHLDDGEYDDSEPAESLPQSIQLLFDVAVRSSSACSEEAFSQPCKVHANVAKSAMGLLADLAANDEEARTSLQGKYAVKAWIGTSSHTLRSPSLGQQYASKNDLLRQRHKLI